MWLLLGGGAALAWYLHSRKTVGRAVQPRPAAAVPTAPTSGGGFLDTLLSKAGEIIGAKAGPSEAQIRAEMAAGHPKHLAGYTAELGADYGSLGGGRYGSLS